MGDMDTAGNPDMDGLARLRATARRVLPEGHFGNFAAAEVIIRNGRGGRVWDEAGRLGEKPA